MRTLRGLERTEEVYPEEGQWGKLSVTQYSGDCSMGWEYSETVWTIERKLRASRSLLRFVSHCNSNP